MTARAGFDEAFYLRHYPDIRRAGLDPYQHFLAHGRAEGRLAMAPELALSPGLAAADPAKPTVLIVSHEASLTGAPILSLNLARGLAGTYNIVALLLGGGPLVDAFREVCVQVAGPVGGRHPDIIRDAIARLAEAHRLHFAVANSIESASVLEPLARRSIASVLLVHEFASYTRPRSIFPDAFFWADEVVFSTRLTYEDALASHPQLAGKRCQILPQGRCVVPGLHDAAGHEQEAARLTAALRPRGEADDALLVLGMGSVQIRKGIDLFLECAARVKAQLGDRCRFAWIGRGFDPEHDLAYSVYLADQLRRAGLEGYVSFLEDTPQIELAYETADVLLLTSRLDPLPNVAIDAMSHGLPLLCFEGTTGIARILADHGMARDCVVPYLDASAMAARIVALAGDPQLRHDIGMRLRALAASTFDLATYVNEIHATALGARERAARELEDALEIQRAGACRLDFLPPPRAVDEELDLIRWGYLRPWTSGIAPRKPFPGFDPGVYHALHAHDGTTDPLTRYLRAGSPPGPWRHEVIGSDEAALPIPPTLRIALHVHAYFPELLADIARRLEHNRVRPDLYVSVGDGDAARRATDLLGGLGGKLVVEVVPNRGRDIGPMLTVFGARLTRDYDVVGHVHTKKTLDVADAAMGETWRGFLLENLLGGASAMADIILGRMAADPSIGLVFPDDPYLVGWGRNLPFAQALCHKLGISGELPEHFVFPVGTMFWARVDALRPLLESGLQWQDYPPEPLPYDGSMLHAMERLLPFLAQSRGSRCVLTHVEGVTR